MRCAVILLVIFSTFFVSSSNYSIVFNQFEDSATVEEIDLGIKSVHVDKNSIEKSSSGYIFLKRLIFNQSYGEAKVSLVLDEGNFIHDGEVYPEGYSVKTNGRNIYVEWNLYNVSPGESIVFLVGIGEEGDFNFILYASVFILVGLIVYLIWLKKSKSKKEVDKYLLDVEKRVLEILREANRHELWQKEIQKNLGLSKAKTSRVVRNLETRGLVEKIPFGNTNKVRLK